MLLKSMCCCTIIHWQLLKTLNVIVMKLMTKCSHSTFDHIIFISNTSWSLSQSFYISNKNSYSLMIKGSIDIGGGTYKYGEQASVWQFEIFLVRNVWRQMNMKPAYLQSDIDVLTHAQDAISLTFFLSCFVAPWLIISLSQPLLASTHPMYSTCRMFKGHIYVYCSNCNLETPSSCDKC